MMFKARETNLTPELKAEKDAADKILFNKEIADDEAEKVIEAINKKLTAAGAPNGELLISRKQARITFKNFF
jgi:hypothetical protein